MYVILLLGLSISALGVLQEQFAWVAVAVVVAGWIATASLWASYPQARRNCHTNCCKFVYCCCPRWHEVYANNQGHNAMTLSVGTPIAQEPSARQGNMKAATARIRVVRVRAKLPGSAPTVDESSDSPRTEAIGQHSNIQHESFSRECVICMDQFSGEQEVAILDCEHRFHSGCLQRWMTTRTPGGPNLSCPSCRAEIPMEEDGSDGSDGSCVAPQPGSGNRDTSEYKWLRIAVHR